VFRTHFFVKAATAFFLLGTTALETFGIDADPTEKKLKPISAIIGGFLASTLTL
jgi:hypothetical protein